MIRTVHKGDLIIARILDNSLLTYLNYKPIGTVRALPGAGRLSSITINTETLYLDVDNDQDDVLVIKDAIVV